MKVQLVLLLICILAASALAKKRHHSERRHKPTTTAPSAGDELDLIAEDESVANTAAEDENTVPTDIEDTPDVEAVKDLCAEFHCGAGKECEVGANGRPRCVCVRRCPVESEDRRKVCSNHNETWDSDCEVYRMRCLCTEDSDECTKDSYKHVHVDYYGGCRDIPACTADEMLDFPRRMRDWLFNVMKDMADRNELDPEYMELEREAERSIQHKWVNAVIWKFCELDSHPHDRAVSRHELFPIRAPLLAMEHCIAPFLDGCDENDDHIITLAEWGKCLGLEEGEIKDKCPK